MSDTLKFEHVHKRYMLGGFRGGLRDALARIGRSPGHAANEGSKLEFWALKDVNFRLAQGEALGIIGPNGAGKTTILKLATFVTRPTSGLIHVRGRISALIELGAGFHPDLTGRENIFLNGTLLGLKRREIEQRFDEIVAFSELERFLDTPVKRYSSGMYARLGFAVAAHVNPEILIVDEVLAVGDAAFQAKCLKRMTDLKRNGTSIMFVTHNLGFSQRLCSRAIFVLGGVVQMEGAVTDVIQAYRDLDVRRPPETALPPPEPAAMPAGSDAVIEYVRFSNGHDAAPVETVATGAELTIHIGYRSNKPVKDANFEMWLYGIDGTEYASFATMWDGLKGQNLDGVGEVCLRLDPLCLMPGSYFVQVAIADKDGLSKYDLHWDRHKLKVVSGPLSFGLLFQPHEWVARDGVLTDGRKADKWTRDASQCG